MIETNTLQRTHLKMEEVTASEDLSRARARREQADQNAAWLQAHASEIYPRHRGKCLCVAGQELFVGDSPEEVLSQARAAHPNDEGFLLHYVPRERVPRVYADQG